MSTELPDASTEIQPYGGGEVQVYKGRCHCKKFGFELKHPSLDVKKPMSCNCSLCTRTGALYIYGPTALFRLDEISAGWDELLGFENKTKTCMHYSCPVCGSFMFGKGADGVGVNARIFDSIEVEKLSLDRFDGYNINLL